MIVACIPSASGCRDTFESLSSTVLRRLGEEDPSMSLDPLIPSSSSSSDQPHIVSAETSLPLSGLPDDLHALDFLLTNPLPAPANTYDLGSNLPTAELDILPELSDIFCANATTTPSSDGGRGGGGSNGFDTQMRLWSGMAPPV
jgi:hypothetical protein